MFRAYPSIAVNARRGVLLGYSRFSRDEFASAAYSYRAAGDSAGSLRDETLLRAGEAPYESGDPNRWGDYSATVVDPRNDVDFWTIQEVAALPRDGADRWSTWWGRIRPPDGHAPFVRGDVNGDGAADLSDAVRILLHLFAAEPVACEEAADAAGDGEAGLPDAVYLLAYLYRGGSEPPAPFPGCGEDPGAAGPLTCALSAACP